MNPLVSSRSTGDGSTASHPSKRASVRCATSTFLRSCSLPLPAVQSNRLGDLAISSPLSMGRYPIATIHVSHSSFESSNIALLVPGIVQPHSGARPRARVCTFFVSNSIIIGSGPRRATEVTSVYDRGAGA